METKYGSTISLNKADQNSSESDDTLDLTGPESDQRSPESSSQGCLKLCTQFPTPVYLIVGNEFCERFSYYGMRAILVLYAMNVLQFSKDDSTALFHGFIVTCYFTPLIGSILADGFVGKYNTILWLSIFYATGNLALAVSSSFHSNSYFHPAADILGLLIIAFGTGGIKPCVSAFGGDQFEKNQQNLLEAFFSFFYLAVNAGALLSTFITPYLRVSKCNGENSCFPAAFGVPAALMVTSIVIFLVGTPWYKRSPPKDNVIFDVTKAIYRGLRNTIIHKMYRKHWLDHYFDDHTCDQDRNCSKLGSCQKVMLIEDIKSLLKICVMFVPLPMFWALFDQQGSRWIIQAVHMDSRLWSGAMLLPDQMPTLNALFIVLFIPLFQMLVYPLVRRCGVHLTPLRKMCFGGFMAALAYVIAMIVQLAVNKCLPVMPSSKEMHLTFLNEFPCKVSLESAEKTLEPFSIDPKMSSYEILHLKPTDPSHGLEWTLILNGCSSAVETHHKFSMPFVPQKAFYTVLSAELIETFPTELQKPESGRGESKISIWTLVSDSKPRLNVSFSVPGPGAVYSLTIIQNHNGSTNSTNLHRLVPENSVSILWQIPQYVILTAAEVMFSVTGLEFSYSQAPKSMKSVIQACWLMTVAFGNIIVMVVAKTLFFDNLASEFLLFAILMTFVMLIFSLLSAYWYTYTDYSQDFHEETTKNTAPKPSKHK